MGELLSSDWHVLLASLPTCVEPAHCLVPGAAGPAVGVGAGAARLPTSTPALSSSLFARLARSTFDYCAPEVLLGRGATPASDVFSYGVVLFQIATGEGLAARCLVLLAPPPPPLPLHPIIRDGGFRIAC